MCLIQSGRLWSGPAAPVEADKEDGFVIRWGERRVRATVPGRGAGSGTDTTGGSEVQKGQRASPVTQSHAVVSFFLKKTFCMCTLCRFTQTITVS